MTTKRVRVLLAAGLLLVLCGGCFGNCLADLSEGVNRGMRGNRSATYPYYLIEADGGPSDTVGDAGVE